MTRFAGSWNGLKQNVCNIGTEHVEDCTGMERGVKEFFRRLNGNVPKSGSKKNGGMSVEEFRRRSAESIGLMMLGGRIFMRTDVVTPHFGGVGRVDGAEVTPSPFALAAADDMEEVEEANDDKRCIAATETTLSTRFSNSSKEHDNIRLSGGSNNTFANCWEADVASISTIQQETTTFAKQSMSSQRLVKHHGKKNILDCHLIYQSTSQLIDCQTLTHSGSISIHPKEKNNKRY
jgi:hypothetical protein